MKPDRKKDLETGLVLTIAAVLGYFLTSGVVFLYFAFGIGFIVLFVKPLAGYITLVWFKLADALNFIVSKLILGTLFFAVLFPVSLVYKIWNRDKLGLKRNKGSAWKLRRHKYTKNDLENTW